MKASSFSAITKSLAIITAVFIGYGYLCRLGIYFFWESLSIGWVLFWIVLISFLTDRIRAKKKLNKIRVGEKIGIGFCVFVIIIKGVLFFATPHTDAYSKAVSAIRNNPAIQAETGAVKSIFLKPVGNISVAQKGEASTGEADLYFIIKGDKKYIDFNLSLVKQESTDWEITGASED